jgi:hypothetical protein
MIWLPVSRWLSFYIMALVISQNGKHDLKYHEVLLLNLEYNFQDGKAQEYA